MTFWNALKRAFISNLKVTLSSFYKMLFMLCLIFSENHYDDNELAKNWKICRFDLFRAFVFHIKVASKLFPKIFAISSPRKWFELGAPKMSKKAKSVAQTLKRFVFDFKRSLKSHIFMYLVVPIRTFLIKEYKSIVSDFIKII